MKVDWCAKARKVSFSDELAAKIALAERLHKDKGEIRYYKCKHHTRGPKHYHLTSEKKRNRNEED